ncbi:hypothetical protein ACMD2_05250 [Ananas comosus]|uniref:DUF4408 domain-containing protein n=1 Tax=Ananas comosus TaxID=4615 RepID=A0A199VYN7_ANACO|nr:hypothetical protein ACMD2_05250 [Ananas comosus]
MGHRWSIKTAAAAAGAGAVWTAVMLCFAGPTIVGFAAAAAPRVRAAVVAWLAPPYLYLVVNAIILSIAASSRFRAAPSGSDPDPDPDSAAAEIAVAAVGEVAEVEEEVVVEREREREREKVETREEKEEEMVREKPLFSVRLGHQNRKSSKKPASSSEAAGKALRVARPRRVETLESTWRTITEGRAVPLARHLRKSDTWEVRGGRSGNVDESPLEPPPMRKAETFHERGGRGSGDGAGSDGGGGKVRREPSLGQEELNRRVEAFINKFNEDMRLQRQQSLLHYMQMINQGSH